MGEDTRNVVASYKAKYFIKWLSFTILKTSPTNIKSKYRVLEKKQLKLTKSICHLKFNETCITNNLLPTYTNVNIHDGAARSEPLVLDFRRNLILRQIEEKSRDIDILTGELKELKVEFSTLLNSPIRFKAFMFFLSRINSKEQEIKQRRHTKELTKLYGGPIMQKQNKESVINLSRVDLKKETIEVLSYGMNCHLKSKYNQTTAKLEIEKLYGNIKSEENKKNVVIDNEELLKSELKTFGLKAKRNINNDVITMEQHTLLKELRQDERIIIRKADKSNVFVILNKDDYIRKVMETIADESKFEYIEKYDLVTFKRNINNLIAAVNACSGGVKLKKLIGHFEPAYLYGNPKIHKSMINPKFRPIISQVGTATYELSKQLNNIIIKYLPNKYIVESTYEFLAIIKNTQFNGKLASLDVESLFTNVPVEETTNIILDNVYRNPQVPPPSSISEPIMRELLLTCTTKSPFRGLDNRLYRQKEGVIMGSCLGPTYANFYMCHIENKIAEEHPECMPLIYSRYVDDIFVLVEKIDDVIKLKELFESYSVLKFTHEIEMDKKLVFLDALLRRHENSISSSVYIKSTNNGDCLDFNSICPHRYKTGVVKTLLHRAYQVSSSWESFTEEVERLKQMFTNNNFPMKIIESIVNDYVRKKIEKEDCVQKQQINLYFQGQMVQNYEVEEKQLKNIVKKYVRPTSEDKELNICIYYKNRKLKNLVMKNKLHKTTENFSVVYKYKCDREECNSSNISYIGYTEATLTERMRNHGQKGSIISHLRDVHNIERIKTKELLESTSVIGRADVQSDLLILEALLIQDQNPALNGQEEGRDRILKIF